MYDKNDAKKLISHFKAQIHGRQKDLQQPNRAPSLGAYMYKKTATAQTLEAERRDRPDSKHLE